MVSIIEGAACWDVTRITQLVVWAGGVEDDSQSRRYANLRLNRPSRGNSTRNVWIPGAPDL